MINITIKEYATSTKQSLYTPLENCVPKPEFGVHVMDVKQMSYEDVKAVIRTLRNFKNWNSIKDVFETCFKIDEDAFWSGKILDFFIAKNYIIETFKKLVEREKKLLQSISKDSVLWEAAGGNRLDKYGDVLPLNQLGKIYGIYPFELKDYKYYDILTLLSLEKDQSEVERRFHELKK